MMVVELNASHKTFSGEYLVIIVSNNLTRIRVACNPFFVNDARFSHHRLIVSDR